MIPICLTSATVLQTDETTETLEGCISRLAQKDFSAMEDLYHLTSASVYSFALSILKNVPDAEDVLHDCFIVLYAQAERYRPQGKPLAWILTITKNLCLKKLRAQKRDAGISPEAWEPFLQANTSLAVEDRITISQCLKTLSDTELQIIVLHAVSGFKHREIAGLLELPLPTVLSKYNRALQKLRRILTGKERTPDERN